MIGEKNKVADSGHQTLASCIGVRDYTDWINLASVELGIFNKFTILGIPIDFWTWLIQLKSKSIKHDHIRIKTVKFAGK